MAAAPDQSVTTRFSTLDGGDGESIRRLAALGEGSLPEGPVVLAELDGRPVAAVGLAGGDAAADPRRAGAAVLFLLHLRRLEALLIGSIWGC